MSKTLWLFFGGLTVIDDLLYLNTLFSCHSLFFLAIDNDELKMTDWDLCFICQKKSDDPVRSTEDGLKTLAENLPNFHELGGLNFDFSRIDDGTDSLLSILRTNGACYHNSCQSRFSNSKLSRLQLSHSKKSAKALERGEQSDIPEKRSRRSLILNDTAETSSFQCCWCNEYDDENNLRAAGQRWAKAKPDPDHLRSITNKWKQMAAVIKHDNVLCKLSSGDVSNNEMFYHNRCLNKYSRLYNSMVSKPSTASVNEEWIKELSLNKLLLHMKDIESTKPGTVFVVGELESMYAESLEGYGINWSCHVSRFANLLIQRTPGLLKGICSGKVSVFFDSAVPSVVKSPEEFFDSLVQVVGPIRKAMLLKCQSNDSTMQFDKESQIQSVPIELLTLINFILEGIDLSTKGFSKESLFISQAMMFNFKSNRNKEAPVVDKRHHISRETPFPLYSAIKIYSMSRSKTIINWLFSCGLCINYKRLLSITTGLANNMIQQYKLEGAFIPSNLRKNVFTIIAKDNIDHNARSTTATKHYHGTSFSVLQFPSLDMPGTVLSNSIETLSVRSKDSLILDKLPSCYTNVHRFLSPQKLLYMTKSPFSVTPSFDQNLYQQEVNKEFEWLKTSFNENESYLFPWAKFHSDKCSAEPRSIDISAILPPIDEPVHTLDMQFHCMNIISKTINVLNPGQIVVDTADEPIFALTKELMIRYPDLYGPDKYFCLFGSLHIEKCFLTIIGQLIKGSGLETILSSCGMSIIGADALVNVNHIKKARYFVQVSLCAIYAKLRKAYSDSGSNEVIDTWLNFRCNSSEMCLYWKIILDLMIDVLVFIRSIREGKFLLYVTILRKLIRWTFALDHYNYARWLSVHIYDLLALPQYSPQLYDSFIEGHFTFKKSERNFSLMGLDQVHEQNNAVMKGMGGVSSLLTREDESAVAKWGLCVHELASIVQDFEFDEENDFGADPEKHHEDTLAFQKRFSSDVGRLEKAIITNPFKLEKLTVLNNEEASFNTSVTEDLRVISEEGEKQFMKFWEKRLVSNDLSLKEPITLNSFNLPGNQTKKAASDPTMTAVMMAKFVDAAKQRQDKVNEVLNTEIFGIAQSLAKDQFNLYHGTKSCIMSIVDVIDTQPTPTNDSGCVIELSMLLRKKLPTSVQTFADYARFLYDEIMDISHQYQRCDVVSDRYFEGSLKEGTRENRGSGTGLVIPFSDLTRLPSQFQSAFLTNATNKTNLNEFLANKFISYHEGKESILTVTVGDTIISNSDQVLKETDISFCSSEEADARMIRHAINLGKQGYKYVTVVTVDCDVVMLGLSYADIVKSNNVNHFYIRYGPKQKVIDIFQNFERLGPEVCKAIAFFHAFTGCDTVSSFYKIGKTKFWNVFYAMIKDGDLTLVLIFNELSNCPKGLSQSTLDSVCNFVYAAYNLTKDMPFNERRRKQLISTPNASLRMLAPSPAAILQHTKRACIQAGYLWKLSEVELKIPDPTEWGWKLTDEGSYAPLWQAEANIDITRIVAYCSCVKGDCSKCSCRKSSMKCLVFCKCEDSKCLNS